MIEEDTVFILGAGASIPYGLPSGQRLVDLICNINADDRRILNKIEEKKVVDDFIADLSEAEPDSIDEFLSNRKEFQKVGKASIARILLPLETNHRLINLWRKQRLLRQNPDFGGHWYKHLFRFLGNDFEEISNSKLNIITFNYDRSLEQYLFVKIKKSYGKRDNESAEALKNMNIIHIYGKLGLLPWQNSDKEHVEYEAWKVKDVNERKKIICNAMENIKTMDDGFKENDKEVNDARSILKNAKQIFILGFGFHPINLELMDIPNIFNRNQKIDGTAFGLNPEEIKKIIKSLTPPAKPTETFENRNIKIEKCDCLDLLRKYLL
jgi:hypothetical protein